VATEAAAIFNSESLLSISYLGGISSSMSLSKAGVCCALLLPDAPDWLLKKRPRSDNALGNGTITSLALNRARAVGENIVDTVEFRVTAPLAAGLSAVGESSIPSSETVSVVWREGPGEPVLVDIVRLGCSVDPSADGSSSPSFEYIEGRDANDAFRPLSGTERAPGLNDVVSSTNFSGLVTTELCSITGIGGRGFSKDSRNDVGAFERRSSSGFDIANCDNRDRRLSSAASAAFEDEELGRGTRSTQYVGELGFPGLPGGVEDVYPGTIAGAAPGGKFFGGVKMKLDLNALGGGTEPSACGRSAL